MDPSTLDTLMVMRSNSDLWLWDAEIWIEAAMREAADATRARRLQQKNSSLLTPISMLSTDDGEEDDTYTF